MGRIVVEFAGHALPDKWTFEETSVREQDKDINLVLIAENPNRASMLRDTLEVTGISGVIRRLEPGSPAIDCARQSGAYREKDLPDLILFDYADPNDRITSILRDLVFSDEKAHVPVILLTSPSSQNLLDTGDVGGEEAIMFSPTSLNSFVGKMKNEKRTSFFKALNTLYQYGPILVRMPESFRQYDSSHTACPA